MAKDLLFVTAGPKSANGKVGLWEVNAQHPKTEEFPEGGETFVSNTKPRLVARTAEVALRLHDGRLKEVPAKDLDKGANLNKDTEITNQRFQTLPHRALGLNGEVLGYGVLPPDDPNEGVGTGELPGQTAASGPTTSS